MPNPFFSIVIPLFNVVNTIEETVNSVKSQTWESWECILVDDYSEDATRSKVKKLIQKDSRFILLNNTLKKGANICRNVGIEKSAGQYLIFLDGDDIISTDCLLTRKEHLEKNTKIQLLISSTSVFKDKMQNGVATIASNYSDHLDLICIFVKTQVSWTIMGATWERYFLKNIGGFNEKYPRLQDVELNIRALMHFPILGKTNNIDSYYRLSGYNLKKQQNAIIGFNLLLRDYYEPLIELFSNYGDKIDKLKLAFSKLIYLIFNDLMILGDKIEQKQQQFFLKTLRLINLEKSDYKLIKEKLKLKML